MNGKNSIALLLGVATAIVGPPAVGQITDPAASTVQTLHNGLLSIMHAGAAAGQTGRTRQIAPVIDRTFDLPQMTRLAVGPSWTGLAPADQSALVVAFRSMTIAQYAKNFDNFSGEHFTMTPQVETRGADKLVRSALVVPHGNPESLSYRLRESGGQWKIIDVYYRNSISQLATRRADFSRVLASGGAKALVAHLNELASRPR